MKNNYYYYVALNVSSYAAIGMLLPLLGQYLNFLEFSGKQIGIITAMATATAIFATTFWGAKYANSPRKKRVVIFLCISSAVIGSGLLAFSSYGTFLVGFMVLYFFQSPLMGLNDAMTIESGQPFSAIRKWGCIGFALATFFAGRLAETVGIFVIFPLYSLAFLLAALVIVFILRMEKNSLLLERMETAKREESQCSGNKQRMGYDEIIKNRRLMALIASSFFLLGTNVANNTYFSFLYIEGGGTLAGVGTVFLLMVGSETVFMAFSSRISAKIGLERAVLIAMLISVVRFLWYSTGPSYTWLLAFFFLQGAVNGILLVEFIRYIHQTVKPAQLGLAISLYYAISNNLSTIFCQFIGGLALDYGGGPGVYLFFAWYNIIGVILYVIFGLYKR
jgi:PPP family 3-phenylpropionic acid transporter